MKKIPALGLGDSGAVGLGAEASMPAVASASSASVNAPAQGKVRSAPLIMAPAEPSALPEPVQASHSGFQEEDY